MKKINIKIFLNLLNIAIFLILTIITSVKISSGKTVSNNSQEEFQIYTQKVTEASFSYISSWYAYDWYNNIRYTDIPAVLVTSFEINPETFNLQNLPKDKEVFVFYFSGSDIPEDKSLVDFLAPKSLGLFNEYPKEVIFGNNSFVTFNGFEGTFYYIRQGVNYYCAFVGNYEKEENDQIISNMLSSIKLPLKDAIKQESGYSTVNQYSQEYLEDIVNKFSLTDSISTIESIPSLKLPWDVGDHDYNSGPHGGTFDNSCDESAKRDVATLSAVDFGMNMETEVLSIAEGSLYDSGYIEYGGYYVVVKHNDSFYSYYWHLLSFNQFTPPADGTLITQGRVIAKSDGTSSTNKHLHLEFRSSTSTHIEAHGISIDSYIIRAIIEISSSKGWNYQGTMTKGSETKKSFKWCDSSTDNAYKWEGSEGTTWAGDGSVSSTNHKNYGDCVPPVSGDWIISTSCTYIGNFSAPAKVVVQNNSILTISENSSLNIDFINYNLEVKNGSGVLIKDGGKIE